MATTLVAFGAVAFGALLTGFGWLIGRAARSREERLRADAAQDTDLVILKRDVLSAIARIERIETRVGHVGEEMAALATIVDRHEQWHARNDPHPPGV